MDEGDVCAQRGLHNVLAAVEPAGVLALFNDGADARGGIECRDAEAARTDALGQGTLRIDVQALGVGLVHFLRGGIADYPGADQVRHTAARQQRGKAGAILAHVVIDNGEALRGVIQEGVDKILGAAAHKKTADHYGVAILNVGESLLHCGNFVHSDLLKIRQCDKLHTDTNINILSKTVNTISTNDFVKLLSKDNIFEFTCDLLSLSLNIVLIFF